MCGLGVLDTCSPIAPQKPSSPLAWLHSLYRFFQHHLQDQCLHVSPVLMWMMTQYQP